jgi:hypothetical protein
MSIVPKTKKGLERSGAFARGGNTPMIKPQAAGPAKPAITGKAQTAAPGKRAAAGGPPIRAASSSKPAAAGHTGPRKGR